MYSSGFSETELATISIKGDFIMKKTKGFTLVELIIVIAVIGVLAAILIPVFSNVINKANQKSALSDARNAVEEFVAAVTTGEGTSMPESVMFAEKGNKVYAFTYTQQGGVEAIDEQGKKIETDFATTVADYEQELVANNTIKARSESETVDMFNAAKNGGIKTGLRTSMALYDNAGQINSDAVLFVERSMLNNLGFDNMVITLSYVPQATLTQNAATVYDTTYSNCFAINGVAQPASMTFAQAIAAAQPGDTIRLYKDVDMGANPVEITKDVTIDGNGHEIKSTRGRIVWVDAPNVNVTIKNVTLDGQNAGSSYPRGFQINSNMANVNATLDNVTIKGVSHYAINVCSGCDNHVINVNNCDITAWAAINTWSSGSINVKNSVLHGVNKFNVSGWNTFSTVCVEGDGAVGGTAGANTSIVTIEDSLIIAEQRTGNKQYAFGFNLNSQNSTITVKNSDIRNNFIEANPEQPSSGLVYNFAASNQIVIDNSTYNVVSEIDDLDYTFTTSGQVLNIPA